MRKPRPLIAYDLETGNATRHASVRDAEKASVRCGSSRPPSTTPSRHARKHPTTRSPFRIDPRTVILVRASKWTPDYAERYLAKMEASRPDRRFSNSESFIKANEGIRKPKRGPGRPRKGAA